MGLGLAYRENLCFNLQYEHSGRTGARSNPLAGVSPVAGPEMRTIAEFGGKTVAEEKRESDDRRDLDRRRSSEEYRGPERRNEADRRSAMDRRAAMKKRIQGE